MIVSMDSRYTLDGEDFTVWTVTKPGRRPVAGYKPDGSIYSFNLDGSLDDSYEQLVEVGPYDHFKIDEPVMVRDTDNESWWPRFFAGLGKAGRPTAWDNGCTRWSSEGEFTHWSQCRRPTAEELAK